MTLLLSKISVIIAESVLKAYGKSMSLLENRGWHKCSLSDNQLKHFKVELNHDST